MMQDIRKFFKNRLNFEQCALRSEPSGYGLSEYRVFKTKNIVKKGTIMNIDFKVHLFYQILPILHRVISECKNHLYFNLEYDETSFEIFIIPVIGRWTALMIGFAENGQSLNEIDPDFGTIDKKYGYINRVVFAYTCIIFTQTRL